MFYNILKCKHLQLGREVNTTDYIMTPNNEERIIQKVRQEKDLGVTIDCKLLFRKHITTKVTTANKVLGDI